MNRYSYIIAAKRSPVTPLNGALSGLSLHEIANPVVQGLLAASGIETSQVNELIVGNALGAGGNPARVIALASGLSEHVAGLTIDRQCCSGLDSLILANDMILSGRASIVVAGGAESYSSRPRRFRKVSTDKSSTTHAATLDSDWEEYDQPAFTPWPDRDPEMSVAASAMADKHGISFEQQNLWTIHSHKKALDAKQRLSNEIIPVNSVGHDTFTRELQMSTCERVKRIHGSISAANTSVAADGAAFCLVVNEKMAASFTGPKLRIRAGTTLGADPRLPALAPVPAINALMSQARINSDDLMRVEMMEAFAAQALACIQQAGFDKSVCNVGGGSLARGHPIAASGTVLMTRLFSELADCGGLGLAAIAAAGGLGTALLVESV